MFPSVTGSWGGWIRALTSSWIDTFLGSWSRARPLADRQLDANTSLITRHRALWRTIKLRWAKNITVYMELFKLTCQSNRWEVRSVLQWSSLIKGNKFSTHTLRKLPGCDWNITWGLRQYANILPSHSELYPDYWGKSVEVVPWTRWINS